MNTLNNTHVHDMYCVLKLKKIIVAVYIVPTCTYECGEEGQCRMTRPRHVHRYTAGFSTKLRRYRPRHT